MSHLKVIGLALAAGLALLSPVQAESGATEQAFARELNSAKSKFIKLAEGASSINWKGRSALNENSSWDEILLLGNPKVPKIQIRSTFYPVTSLCVDGANIRPNNPWHGECVRWERRGDDEQCVETKPIFHTTPIQYQYELCVRSRNGGDGDVVCEESVTRTALHALSYNIFVRGDAPRSFYKRFDVPVCK